MRAGDGRRHPTDAAPGDTARGPPHLRRLRTGHGRDWIGVEIAGNAPDGGFVRSTAPPAPGGYLQSALLTIAPYFWKPQAALLLIQRA